MTAKANLVRCMIGALSICVLCLATFPAAAQDSDTAVAPAVADTAPANGDGAIIEVPVEPIVIESDAPTPEPTLDQLMRKFRDALGQPPSFVVSERQLGGGILELTTRFGRLCARALPPQFQSGLGGDISIAAPCASF